jgi:nucleoside-diphosphate-sugar epimerase
MNSNKTISVLGAGWLGFELAKNLIAQGHQVKASTTTPAKLDLLVAAGIDAYLINLSDEISSSSFFDADILIINIPPGRRDPNVETNYPARIEKALKFAKNRGIKNVVLVSSTGVYVCEVIEAPQWNFPIYIDSGPNAAGKSAAALIQAEYLLRKYFDINGTIIRFGGLVGGERLAGRFLAGKKDIPNGQAPVNMIHRDDCIGILKEVIQQEAWGKTYNATTDEHPCRQDFYIAQADKYEFEPPIFLEETQASGKVISNKVLKEDLGYRFIHPDPMLF